MIENLYLRGSEWRKWDLQVHTPHSALNNGFGDDFDDYARRLILSAIENEIAVIGITDYFLIDGYSEFRKILSDDSKLELLIGADNVNKAKNILFLPNVELRSSIIVTRKDGKDSRVNFHVIFSNQIAPEDIQENFLRELKFTAESPPSSQDEKWSLTKQNLIDLGKRLKEQHKDFSNQSDLFTGMMNAVINHSDVTEVLERQSSRFKDRYLIITPADEDLSECHWNGQGHLTRKLLIQKSHMLFSSNTSTRDFALGNKHNSHEDYLSEFKTFKPCVHSSDCHSFETLFNPDGNRFTWVKSDPTFNGLRQLLNEASDRVYVGTVPPVLERVRLRATKTVNELSIKKTGRSAISEDWFDVTLPISSELVAIIGNKGSGKSALADVFGLLGNTPRHTSFSFLRNDRFRNNKNNKSKHFEACLTWNDGNTEPYVNLSANPDPDSVEKIKYIPQNYLEEICNEVGLGTGSQFYSELQQVIFSHVPFAERLGFTSLNDLLDHRSKEIKESINYIVNEIEALNKKIVALPYFAEKPLHVVL